MGTLKSALICMILAMCASALLPLSLDAQTVPDFSSGLTPYQGYHGGDIDSINMASGSLNLHIPLISFPQRGSALKLDFSLVYNSTVVKRVLTGTGPGGGYQWSFVDTNPGTVQVVDGQGYSLNQTIDCAPNGPPCGKPNQVYSYYYSLLSPDGAQHMMGYTSGTPRQAAGTQTLRSLDGTGLALTIQDTAYGGMFRQVNSATAYDSSGVVYSGAAVLGNLATSLGSTRQDSNGNQITNDGRNYIDTMGRTVPVPPPTGGYSSNTDASGCAGPRPVIAQILWTVPGYNGTNYPLKFCYANLTINIPNDGAGAPNYGDDDGAAAAVTVLQSVVIPDSQTLSFSSANTTAWEFEYDDQDSSGQYGSLTKITLPTGGTISYTYSTMGNTWLLQRAVRTRTVSDGTNSRTWTYDYTWTQSFHNATTVTAPIEPYDPQPNVSVHSISGLSIREWDSGYETQVSYYQGPASGTPLKTVTKAFNVYSNPYHGSPGSGFGFGPMKAGMTPASTTTTLSGTQVSQVKYTYDPGFAVYYTSGDLSSTTIPYGLQTDASYYDYGSGAPGSLLKTDHTTYLWQSNSNYLTANLLNLKSALITKDASGNRMAETDYTYDNASLLTSAGISTQHGSSPTGTRGNPSTVINVLIGGSSNPTTTLSYYDTGELYKSTDPMNNATTYGYSSAYAGAYVTQTNLPDTCSPNCVHHIASGVYDFNTGVLTSYADQNSQTTTIDYDGARRIRLGTLPAGGGQKTFEYTDALGQLQVTAKTQQTPSTWLQKTIKFDSLGRSAQSITTDPEGDDSTETSYDATGHTYKVTNPHRSGSSTTDGEMQSQYDGTGRGNISIAQDGGVVTTLYDGNCSTVTDEAGRARKTCNDALGRMTQVFEDPGGKNYQTIYVYDALSNLTCVEQHGGLNGTGCSSAPATDSTSPWRVRRFTYDSLSRLLTAKNPETGTIQYSYNAASDLISKTDARGVTTNFSPSANPIDPLHRVIQKTYSSGDPAVTYSYDATANGNYGIGLRTGMTDASGSTSWVFDPMGRAIMETDVIGGVQKTISTSYNLDSSVSTIIYPTGSVVSYSYDTAGHITSVADTANNITYAQDALYTPPGPLAMMAYGSIVQTNIYNRRLQPCWIYVGFTNPLDPSMPCGGSADPGDLLDLQYDFGPGTNNNGNLLSVTNNANKVLSKSFSYDSLNRLQGYQTTNSALWSVAYTIDPWGNLTNKTPQPQYGGEMLSAPANSMNKLIGFSYDVAGNVTNDGNNAYTFNAENQILSASGVSFVYDGDGERVQKSDGTTYWGGGSSGALVESDNGGTPKAEYIYFNGKRIARRDLPSGDVKLYLADNLGSASVISNFDGNLLEEYDYGPFGELHWQGSTTPMVCYNANLTIRRCPISIGGQLPMVAPGDSNHYMFTGKERDSETGLDYFGARYYSNNIGRWLSPDWAAKPTAVPYANYGNPQSLNLYAYVVNRPTTTADPDGHQEGQPTTVDPMHDMRSPGLKSLESYKMDGGPAGAGTEQAAQQTLDGNLHTTHNADGTTSSYQGTTSSTTTTDSKGNVVSTTTTSSVTTQTLNPHGDIVQTTTSTTSTTVGANGRVTGSSSSVVGLQDNSQQAQNMRSGSLSFGQRNVSDFFGFNQATKTILDQIRVTPNDVIDGIKAFGERASKSSYQCAKAGTGCY